MGKPDTDLLQEIENYCWRSCTSVSRFGRLAAHDPALVLDLRNGRKLRPATADRVRAFIVKMST